MAALFCLGMLLYFVITLRARSTGGRELVKLLWLIYFALGLSAMFIAATDVLRPVYPPNYLAALFLLACVLVSISGFLAFHAKSVAAMIGSIRRQSLIEGILIGSQFYATLFFLPFAIASLLGDANENRLDLANKMEQLGSYGIFNTLAGAASQLFGASLIFGCVRLAQPEGRGRSTARASMLIAASLSYVIYILAYVGRDGVVYWLMTALAVFVVFRPHIPRNMCQRIVALGMAIASLLLLPFVAITVARFVDTDYGSAWSVLDYFGSQIHNFSDYSSIERPLTLGISNFPMFGGALCSALGISCDNLADLKEVIFGQYLAQNKEPWLFGTYVSDFVGDFGYLGTLVFLSAVAVLSHYACRTQGGSRPPSISRFLLIMFLFLVPYWGVFYFRWSIINGFIVVNLAFIAFVHFAQRGGGRRGRGARVGQRERHYSPNRPLGRPDSLGSSSLDLEEEPRVDADHARRAESSTWRAQRVVRLARWT